MGLVMIKSYATQQSTQHLSNDTVGIDLRRFESSLLLLCRPVEACRATVDLLVWISWWMWLRNTSGGNAALSSSARPCSLCNELCIDILVHILRCLQIVQNLDTRLVCRSFKISTQDFGPAVGCGATLLSYIESNSNKAKLKNFSGKTDEHHGQNHLRARGKVVVRARQVKSLCQR